MPTVQDQPAEFTASDILSPKLWKSEASRPPLGIDISCTKVAVDFQNVTAETADAVIRQNLAWAVLYNLAALPLAALGLIPPWAAAIGMSASSLLVVGNALRLRSDPPAGPQPERHAIGAEVAA